jgi:hypothetical protein
MKFLFFFWFISCTKVSYENIPGQKNAEHLSSSLRVDKSLYDENIDLFVAFLWPAKIKSMKDKQILRDIISTSRIIKKRKEEYQGIRLTLRQDFERFECPCLLEFRCQGDETQVDENKCLELEDGMISNEGKLPPIYKLVLELKENVHQIGGEWLSTNQDFPELPVSQMDFNNFNLKLTVFGDSLGQPLAYEIKNPLLIDDGELQLLTYSAQRKREEGSWRIEVAPLITSSSLLFQGELFWIKNGKKRQGFIYWEHARKL